MTTKTERVTARLRAEIEAGRWGPGEKLPSQRALAREYGTHPAAISDAMRRLRGEGLLVGGEAATTSSLGGNRPSPRLPGARTRAAAERDI